MTDLTENIPLDLPAHLETLWDGKLNTTFTILRDALVLADGVVNSQQATIGTLTNRIQVLESGGVPGPPVIPTSGLAVSTLPTDGTTDIGAIVQSAYDAGQRLIVLQQNGVYNWNTPVFLDRANDTYGGLTIMGNKATIKLGSGLPTTDWSKDTGTQFAIFPNTQRSAKSGSTVTVSDSTRATGTSGALRTLVLRDVHLDGQGNNRGFSFANRTAVTFENVIVHQMRVGATWWDYADGNTFINCYSKNGGPTNQQVVEQYQNGDGVVIINGKADSNISFASLKLCRGAFISGIVTGAMTFDNCVGIHIVGVHQEGQQSTRTMVTMKSSQVFIESSVLYENWSSSVPTISIDDTGSTETGSELVLSNVVTTQLITSSVANSPASPLVNVVGASDNTRIRGINVKGMHASTGIAGTFVDAVQPYITGPTALQSALDSARGRAALASGDFTVRKIAGSTWAVETVGEQLYVSKKHAAPVISSISASPGFSGGGLTNGTTYSYAAAVYDALGNLSAVSSEVSVAVNSAGITRLLLNLQSGAGAVVLFRKASSSGAASSPTAYTVLPLRSERAYVYDMGSYANGRLWSTSSIPTPSSSNATLSRLVLNGLPMPSVFSGTTAPLNPQPGDLWVDTN